MEITGFLQGLGHRYGTPVQYVIQLQDSEVELNPNIGRHILIEFLGAIQCIACGRKIRKTFNNGYCYPCFTTLAENDLCIVKPHECHYHLGTCRDQGFAERHCMIPHYVYLALSSDVKVGLTRKNNEIKRWVDQGAVRAIPIAELPSRKAAGELEYYLSQTMPDKTNWRKMLKGEVEDVDLLEIRDLVHSRFPKEFEPYKVYYEEITEIQYPVGQAVEKLTSFNLDKEQIIEGKLIGAKGQYLLLEQGVINMRKFAGYQIKISVSS